MKTVKTVDNQIILDFALTWYGTAEAIGEIMTLNPSIRNDSAAMIEAGITPGDFYPDIKLAIGQDILINDESRMIKPNTVKKIGGTVATYTSKKWHDQLNR